MPSTLILRGDGTCWFESLQKSKAFDEVGDRVPLAFLRLTVNLFFFAPLCSLPLSSPTPPTKTNTAAPSPAFSSAKHFAAALATSALLLASSADAKVILAKGAPKKVFQGADSTAPRDRSSAGGAAKAKKASGPAFGSGATPSFGAGSIGIIALPVAVLGIAGAAAAASVADSGFAKFIDGASLRDSNNYAGYEPALKSEGGPPMRAAGGAAPKKRSFLKKK